MKCFSFYFLIAFDTTLILKKLKIKMLAFLISTDMVLEGAF